MLVVVNQPHTDGFRIEGNIPKDILDYVEAKYSKKDISVMDDDGDELTEDGAFLKKWTKEQKYGIIVDTSKEEKRCQQSNTMKTSKSHW